jgi:succinate dehydrogenase / fumarate reductase flavoprotein subunit
MFNYVPDLFRKETAETEEEADLWYKDHSAARRTPDLLPRDEVARAINAEVKAGRGTPHGGVYLDVSTRLSPDVIKRRLPSMYHQFLELADVDITKEPMEIAPTCHYTMGGIRVDAETQAATIPGLYACGESAGGMHGANRLGGNSLSDLLVFGKRAGEHAAQYAAGKEGTPKLSEGQITDVTRTVLGPFERVEGENPYTVLHDLQEMLHNLVGIIRTESELNEATGKFAELKDRASKVRATGNRAYNPGWNTAIDLTNMLMVAEGCTKAALARRESRGGHTREDYPSTDPELAKINHAVRWANGEVTITPTPLPQMPDELMKIVEETPE